MSAWITHVKNYASKNNINYSTALKDPNCSKTYKEINGGALKGLNPNKKIEILKYSNPNKALNNAIKYLKKDIVMGLSTKKTKKYMVQRPDGKWIHFGEMNFEDFTKHNDNKRRLAYLKRTENIKGDWKKDKYSANNLARAILWESYKVGSGVGSSSDNPIPAIARLVVPNITNASIDIDTSGTERINMLVDSMNNIRQQVKYLLEDEDSDNLNEIYYLNSLFKNNYDELQTLVNFELENWVNLLSDDRINILSQEVVMEEPDIVGDALLNITERYRGLQR